MFASLPETFTVTVDKGGGEMVELTLSKHSVRPANFRILSWDSTNGHVVEHDSTNPAMPARTYRGHVSENPNELVLAVIHSDNTIQAEAHNGSGRLWTVSGIDVTTELGNGTATVPTPAPLAAGSGTPVAANLPGQYLPAVGLYRAHGVEDVPSQFYDNNGQSLEQTMVWLEHQWNVLDFFNARDTKLSMELSEVIIRKEQFYTPTAGNAGQFNSMLKTEWDAQGQNTRGFIHSWFPYNFTYAGGYASGNEFYGANHSVSVNALYHEAAHTWRAQHYFYGKETMTGSHPSHGEMNTQRILYTRQIQIDQDDGIELLTSYPTKLHPRAYQDVASTSENTAVNISPLANDHDANGDAISIKSYDTTTARGGSVTEAGGVLTYTPASGYVGKDLIVYEVQDATGLYTKGAIHVEVINHGLAGHWSMEETSGTSAADSTGHTHTGTLVGADFGADSVAGPVGNAIALNVGGYIIGDDSNLVTGSDAVYPLDSAASNFFDPMDESFTAATWFKIAPGSSSVNLFSKRNNAALGFLLSANTASGISTSVKPWDGLEGTRSVSGGTVAEDTWYHAAMVINRSDNTLRLFLNGAEVGTAATLPADFYIFNGREDLKIGGGDAVSLDEAQIYTKPLSLAEIQALHSVGDVPAGQALPKNLAVNIPADADIAWVTGQASYQHDVYFGTDEAAVAAATTASPEYKGRQTATSFDPGALNYGQNYFWRVDEIDGSTTIGGSVWRFSTAASSINENLVLHFSMDDSDVQTADGVTHTFDDTALPAQDFNNMSVVPGQTGVIGQAGVFSGASDTLRSVVTSPVSRPATGGVTVSFWINTTSTESAKKIYDGGGAFFMLYYNGDLMTVFDGSSGGSSTFDANVNDGQWHHVVAHNDGANLTTVYVDGVAIGSQSEGLYDIATLNRNFSIGSNYNTATSENLDASIDDFAVWERALSVGEITAIHTAGLAGNSFNDVPVLVDTSFEESEGFTGFNAGGLQALGSVTDNDGVVWTGNSDSQIWNRSDIPPAGIQNLAFGVGGSSGQTDVSIPGTDHGVGTVNFDYASFSGSANATFKLLYNDNTGSGWNEAWSTQVVGNDPNFSTKPWQSVEVALNIPGDVDLRFETSGVKGAMIDNVKVTGLVNQAPVVDDTSGNIAENVSNGAAVATVTSTDPGDSISYAITGGNTGNAFTINSSTGEITTAAALDFETTASYSLVITGTDSGGLADTGTVTVTVVNVNEAPTAIDNSGSLAENTSSGAAIATVSASDPDAGDSLSYAITAGNAGNAFAIDSNGNITTTTALDFETTASYALTVTVTDGAGLSDTAAVNVAVTNVNEAPTASDNSGSLAENGSAGTAVATVATSDPDSGDSVSYAITAGNTGNVFAIDTNGNITTTTALDFETTPSYALTVTVTDGGGLSDSATVAVTVTNVNEAIVANDNSGTVAEDVTIGSAVATVATSDPDSGDSVSFAITAGNTGNAFAIDTAGNITTTAALDFETTPSYSLTVTATDGGGLSDSAAVIVNVTNINEAPVVTDNSGTVAEDVSVGTAVATVSSTDPDTGDSVSYAITAGNTGSAFVIDSNTGDITTTAVLDFETTASYILTVTATDGGGLSDTASVTVTVTDAQEALFRSNWNALADQNPVADPNTYFDGTVATLAGTIDFEGVSGNLRLWNGGVGDKDFIGSGASDVFENVIEITSAQYANDTEYTLSYVVGTGASSARTGDWFIEFGTKDGGVFTPLGIVDSGSASNVSGSLALLDSENLMDNNNSSALFAYNVGGRVLNVTFNPGDAATGENIAFRFGTTSSNLYAGISDMLLDSTDVVDPNVAPVASDSSGNLAEDAVIGSAVATVSATDPNSGDTLSYAITAGNIGNAFAIDNSGNISTAAGLDFETAAGHTLTVEVTDNGGLTDTATVPVTVTDVNEAPVANDNSGTLAEDAAVTSAVATVSANDVDAGDSLSYAITAGNTGNAFAIDSNGNITTASGLDFETTAGYTLTVTVTDSGSLTDTATVPVTITDVVETTAPVVATGSASNLGLTTADIGYSITDDGGEAPTVTLYYGGTDGGTTPSNWNNSVAVGAQATGSYVESLTGLSEGTSYYFTIAATNSVGTTWGSSGSFATTADTSPKMVRSTVNSVSSTNWTTVDLGKNYNSAVIVATPIYADSTQVPVVTRIRNASGSSFDLKLDRADGLTADVTCDVSVIAVEEGVYTLATDGVQMEAVKFTSTITAENNSWNAEARTYQNSYTTPVVVGQVMSANDANWSTFWSMGSSRLNPADASNLNVGKHVAEDTNTTRANETIGYIVIESGNGTINGVVYTAAVGTDIVRNYENSASGYSYSLTGLTSASAAALSSAAMDGADGAWPVLNGVDALSSTTLKLIVDEDQLKDSERKHATEQINYIIFE